MEQRREKREDSPAEAAEKGRWGKGRVGLTGGGAGEGGSRAGSGGTGIEAFNFMLLHPTRLFRHQRRTDQRESGFRTGTCPGNINLAVP